MRSLFFKIKNQDLIFDFLVTPQVQKVNPLPELDGTLRSPYGKCPASAYPKEHALPVPACNALHGLHCTMARLPRQPKPVMMMPPQIIFTASKPPAGQRIFRENLSGSGTDYTLQALPYKRSLQTTQIVMAHKCSQAQTIWRVQALTLLDFATRPDFLAIAPTVATEMIQLYYDSSLGPGKAGQGSVKSDVCLPLTVTAGRSRFEFLFL